MIGRPVVDTYWKYEDIIDVPNKVVSDSAASRNSVVGTALSLAASTGTSTKDLRRVSNQVPPAGCVSLAGIDMMRSVDHNGLIERVTTQQCQKDCLRDDAVVGGEARVCERL